MKNGRNPSDSIWRVGQILPGPRLANGKDQWFYVSSVSDDNQGDFNYTLTPVYNIQDKQNRPPFIKLYRSTAADGEAVNSTESINADLNPKGAPGSLNPKMADKYEDPEFIARTIPVWVGYLLYGLRMEDISYEKTPGSDALYKQALKEYLKAFPHAMLPAAATCSTPSQIRNFLLSQANALQELPQYKIAQDIAHVGHSLGASLAQFGMHYFGPKRHRLPCPGFNYICKTFDPPMTNTKTDVAFMAFGRQHRELIRGLGQQWQVHHQMEYGDIVPLAGGSHLATNAYDPDIDGGWLKVDIQVFRPANETRALALTSLPTHGRRIGLATQQVDYQITKLTPKQLHEFDHAWWLSQDLLKIFGFYLIMSPVLWEVSRRVVSAVTYPFRSVASAIANRLYPPLGARDADGILFCRYKPQ